jgi:hypothetical protein
MDHAEFEDLTVVTKKNMVFWIANCKFVRGPAAYWRTYSNWTALQPRSPYSHCETRVACYFLSLVLFPLLSLTP